MNELINEIDGVLKDFISGAVSVKNFEQYMALERIAVIVNKHRNNPDKESATLEELFDL